MAQLSNALTAYSIAQSLGDSGKQLQIVDVLQEKNEMLRDAPVVQCNQKVYHQYAVRDTYPKSVLRGYNTGFPHASSNVRIKSDGCAKRSLGCIVDAHEAEDSGNVSQARDLMRRPVLIGMARDQEEDLIYLEESDSVFGAKAFNGLARRYKDPAIDDASGRNMFDFWPIFSDDPLTGADKVTTLYLVAWGTKLAHLIVPQGSGVGIQHEDHGKIRLEAPLASSIDGSVKGGNYAYEDEYTMQYGLSVEHPDAVKRLCNIPVYVPGTIHDESYKYKAQAFIDLLDHAQRLLPVEATAGNIAIYGNKRALGLLKSMARWYGITVNSTTDPFGFTLDTINGINIRECDIIKQDATEQVAFDY